MEVFGLTQTCRTTCTISYLRQNTADVPGRIGTKTRCPIWAARDPGGQTTSSIGIVVCTIHTFVPVLVKFSKTVLHHT